MAGSILTTPAGLNFQIQPSAERVISAANYITTFNFLNQYLPDTYEKEFERYGNRSVASFLRMVGAELPSASDQIRWAEQGRLHIRYNAVTTAVAGGVVTCTVTDTYAPAPITTAAMRVGATVLIQNNTTGAINKGIVTTVPSAFVFTVAVYEATVTVGATTGGCSVFIYGSEFAKGTSGMSGTLDSEDEFFSNSPIILKDNYTVTGSDMAQVGWVEITSENGATGYLWYLKSQADARQRFDDYLETAMIEAVPAAAGSGAAAAGFKGTEGVFFVVGSRGNVWGGGTPTTLTEWDTIVARLDRQGAIEENVVFVNRGFGFDIDNMLAGLNGYSASGAANAASYGLFDNDVQMALNLGFSGFRRGYDFYKSDWKYLNDPTMRGALATTGASNTNTIGLLVPAGTTSVYDQIMGKNAKRPFLHVRYRASETEDRRYKTWITGSAGGAATSDLDAMQVNFLSERCVCTLGANNFMLFRYGS